jgi:hypothetical protein
LRPVSRTGKGRPGPSPVRERTIDPVRAIRCRSCGHAVTSQQQKFAVDGAHSHTFFNPSGIVFQLGCFRDAEGCLNSGEPTSLFSWFAGYSWRYSLCGNCQRHLGWFFMGGEVSFYGLILTNLSQ